jgi:hypothetical protein
MPFGEGYDEPVAAERVVIRPTTGQLLVVTVENGATVTRYYNLHASGAGDHTRCQE